MKTRPVFESFSQFVDFLNYGDNLSILEAATTGMTVDDFIKNQSSFFDDEAKEALSKLKIAASASPIMTKKDSKVLATLQEGLAELSNEMVKITKKEDQGLIDFYYAGTSAPKSATEETPGQNVIEVTQYYNGKVKIGMSPDSTYLKSNSFNSLEDVLSYINAQNIKSNYTFPFIDSDTADKKNKRFYGESGKIKNSGSTNQTVVTSTKTGFNFAKMSFDENTGNSEEKPLEPGTSPSDILENIYGLGEGYSTNTKEGKNIQTVTKQRVIYGILNVIPGGGDTIPADYVKKEIVTTVVPGEVKTVPRSLSGTDKMFVQGEIGLKNDTDKQLVMKSIDSLLSEFNSIQKIVITGGASFEGGLELNKTLVEGRAKTIQALILEYHTELSDKIVTVNATDKKFDKIQKEDKSSEYEKFRKIYLDVTGTVIGDSKTVSIERDVVYGEIKKMDKVIIGQYILNFAISIPSGDSE